MEYMHLTDFDNLMDHFAYWRLKRWKNV